MKKKTTPDTISELLHNCSQIAGQTVADLAKEAKLVIPPDLSKVKGWLGELLEIQLGTDASNKPIPDFQKLGIELKTLPINKNKVPSESTYVCTAPINNLDSNWESSRVKSKLNHVLWVPIESDKSIPLANRRIGAPFLWQPNKTDTAILKQDWEELTTLLTLGELENISAKYGTYLQLRPKAANSKVLIETLAANGEIIKIVPKGFYLRASFTRMIVAKQFNLLS